MAKILLVEDDSNLREIYGARLEAEGYEIISASDGEEALALAVRERPELIISDVMMPKISGFDMLDILRSTPETRSVKVIVMTALSQEEDRKRGEQLGADRYLVKSQVTLDDVVGITKELLGAAAASAPQLGSDDTTTAAQPDPATDGVPVTVSVQSSGSDDPVSAADEDSLNKEVEQFVASSPLMNGVAPQPAASESDSSQQPPAPAA